MTPYTVAYFERENEWKGPHLSLSLLIGTDVLHMAIKNEAEEVLGVGGFDFPSCEGEALTTMVSGILNDYHVYTTRFEKVFISITNRDFTLVPEAFYQPDHVKSLFSFATGKAESVLGGKLPGLYFCYAVHPDLLQWCESQFSQAVVFHTGMVTLSMWLGHTPTNEAGVFMHVGNSLLELAIVRHGQVEFYNVFHFENSEDILYYLLFSMEQNGLNPHQTQVYLAAQKPIQDALFSEMHKYVLRVNFIKSDPHIKYKAGKTLPGHYFYHVLHQSLCAS